MPKTIKIPLEMKNGEKATDMKSLVANFDVESVVGYFLDGKLKKWLDDRYYEEEAEKVSQLEKDDPALAAKLCEIFGVPYEAEVEIDTEELAERKERLSHLKQLTDDEEILHNIDSVAFNQEDLADLYDKGAQKIYLCEGDFHIPKSKQELEYVLIADTTVEGLKKESESVADIPTIVEDESCFGIVKDIHLDAGKKGYRTIQVDLETPVFIGGVKYDHVPVLSAGIFNEMKLRKGSKIRVFRTGDVIPSIEVTDAGNGNLIKLPTECPYCGNTLDIRAKKLFCSHMHCKGNAMGRVIGYLKGIGVEGYDEITIDKLFNDQFGNAMDYQAPTINGLYQLVDEKFHSALINATENCPDYKVVGAIGITDLGPARAKIILKAAGGFDKFIESFKVDKAAEALMAILPEGNLRYIVRNTMESADTKFTLRNIRKYMKNITTDFSDKITVGHTGYTPSEQVLNICKANSFDITDGKKFDLLITGDFSSKSDKMMKAIEKNIPIYNEESFINRFSDTHEISQHLDSVDIESLSEELGYYPVI